MDHDPRNFATEQRLHGIRLPLRTWVALLGHRYYLWHFHGVHRSYYRLKQGNRALWQNWRKEVRGWSPYLERNCCKFDSNGSWIFCPRNSSVSYPDSSRYLRWASSSRSLNHCGICCFQPPSYLRSLHLCCRWGRTKEGAEHRSVCYHCDRFSLRVRLVIPCARDYFPIKGYHSWSMAHSHLLRFAHSLRLLGWYFPSVS